MNQVGPRRRPGPVRAWLGDWGGRFVLGLSMYGVLYAVWTSQHWGGPERVPLISSLAFIPVTAASTFLAFRTASHPALDLNTRSAWRTIGFALVILWVSGLLRVLQELIRGAPAFPSFGDLVYVAYYPILFLGLTRFPRRRLQGVANARFWIDVLTVVLGGGAIIWFFVLGPVASSQQTGWLPSAVAAFYPIGDLALIFAVAVVLFGGTESLETTPFLALLASLLAFVVADLTYSYQSLAGTYRGAGWWSALYIVGQALPGIAAHLHYRQAWRPGSPRTASRAGGELLARLPYGVVAISSALLLASVQAESWALVSGLVIITIALTWLAFVNQAILLRENVRLATARASFADRIESAYEAAAAVAWQAAPETVRDHIMADVRRLTGATHAALFHWDPQTGSTRLIRTEPALGRAASQACLRLAVRVARIGKTIQSADPADESLQELHGTIGSQSYAALPWRGPTGMAGMLVLCADRSAAFPETIDDESFATIEALRMYVAVAAAAWRGVTNEAALEPLDTTSITSPGASPAIEALRQGILPTLDTARDRLELLALDDPALSPGQREAVLIEIQQAMRLFTSLIEELHISDLLQRSALVIEPIPLDAVTQAHDVLASGAVSWRGRAVRVVDDGRHPSALADVGFFPRMLEILLQNAVSYSVRDSEIDLLIGGSPGQVTFEVVDRGPGIPMGERERVWEPFYRLPTGGPSEPGLGLGLPILRGLVALHGGEIWLKSETNVTRVGFWLPAADQPEPVTSNRIIGSFAFAALTSLRP